MNKNEFGSRWVFGSQQEKNDIVKELAQKNIWANDKFTTRLPIEVKERVVEHILKCNAEWAYTLWVEATHIYLNSDCTVQLGVYGEFFGDIKFPKVPGIKCQIWWEENAHHIDVDYYGYEIRVESFECE